MIRAVVVYGEKPAQAASVRPILRDARLQRAPQDEDFVQAKS
jgi:hypothetical protein